MTDKKEQAIYYLSLGLAIALLISLLANSFYTTTPVRSQEVSSTQEDIFKHGPTEYKLLYYPEGKLGLLSEPSIKIYPIPWTYGNEKLIPITQCLNSCMYDNFKISINPINNDTIYYKMYYTEDINLQNGIFNRTTIFIFIIFLIVLIYLFILKQKSKPKQEHKEEPKDIDKTI